MLIQSKRMGCDMADGKWAALGAIGTATGAVVAVLAWLWPTHDAGGSSTADAAGSGRPAVAGTTGNVAQALGQAASTPSTSAAPRVLFSNSRLTMSAPDCTGGENIDLEKPQTDVPGGGGDLHYDCNSTSPNWFSLSPMPGEALAVAPPQPSESSCNAALNTSSTTLYDLHDAVAGQTAWCVRTTNGDISLVRLISLGNADDGALTVDATTWRP